MSGLHAFGSNRQLGVLSPLTAVVFSAVCWLVFSRVFDTREVDALPELTRRFLLVQPWWLGAGLLGIGTTLLSRTADDESIWKNVGLGYSFALAVFSVVNIGWGIVAIFLLTLPPSGI